MTLKQILEDYYKTTGRVWPNFDDAMRFADTEKAEALEIYLAQKTHYVRNHPENKPKWDKDRFEEELGDFMMMIQVAGMVEGCDPFSGLIKKLSRKMKKRYIDNGFSCENVRIEFLNKNPLVGFEHSSINSVMSQYTSDFAQKAFKKLDVNPKDPTIMIRGKWVIRTSSQFPEKTAFMFDGEKLLEYQMTKNGVVIKTYA